MSTDLITFIFGSEKRKKIVRTLLNYPKRQWSCSSMEEITKLSHATTFRILKILRDYNLLKSFKINKKDVIYEIAESPVVEEIERILNIEKITIKKIVKKFLGKLNLKDIYSVILYGSGVKGDLKPESDIDLLIVPNKQSKILKREILDKAGRLSSDINKTLAVLVMDKKEIEKEKKDQFIKDIKENMEIIYGKKPF